jgi:chromosome segregation ATPase
MKRFEALEERIRRAVALIRELKEERATLERRLSDRESELAAQKAELADRRSEIRELREEIEAGGAGMADAEAVRELDGLRSERKEILSRVERMLRLLDDAAALSGQEDLLAAVD